MYKRRYMSLEYSYRIEDYKQVILRIWQTLRHTELCDTKRYIIYWITGGWLFRFFFIIFPVNFVRRTMERVPTKNERVYLLHCLAGSLNNNGKNKRTKAHQFNWIQCHTMVLILKEKLSKIGKKRIVLDETCGIFFFF